MDAKPSERSAAEAARWHARLHAQDCTAEERQAFRNWLAQDPAGARAYQRAERISRRVDQLAMRDPRLRNLAAAALKEPGDSRHVLHWRAAAVLVVGLALALALTLQRGGWMERPATAHYANAGMQRQLVELSDGSRVHLDVGARLEVRFTRSERKLELSGGRAYFEVAREASRPFLVDAAGVRTVALGTRFQVAIAAAGVAVTLAEGSVAVSDHLQGRWTEVLRPGDQLLSGAPADDRVRHDVDMSVVLGWSSGHLVYSEAPLAEVLEEINRYAEVKLRLGDQSLGTVLVGGTFIAGADNAQVAAALSAALPLSAVQVGAREIVLFRRYEAAD